MLGKILNILTPKAQQFDIQTLANLINFMKRHKIIRYDKEISEKLGYDRAYISQVKNGHERFTKTMLENIISEFNIIVADDDTQQSDNLRYINTSHRESDQLLQEPVDTFRTKNNEFRSFRGITAMRVPIVPMDAYAQYIDEFYNEAADITFEYGWVEVDSYGKGNYLQFKVSGDSMNGGMIDDTPHGAVVLAREIGQHLWTGGLYKSQYGHILITNANILFKDIVAFDKEKGIITCHSRNTSPEYQDFTLHLGEQEDDKPFVRQIFKVIKRNNM